VAPLRGTAGPASAPRSAFEGPRGARRATPQGLTRSAQLIRHASQIRAPSRPFHGRAIFDTYGYYAADPAAIASMNPHGKTRTSTLTMTSWSTTT